jgi:hypothetical protein
MYLWNVEGLQISETMSATNIGGTVVIHGVAIYKQRLLCWSAIPLSHGWHIEIVSSSNRHESFQGSTFNLALEVASAIRRSIG